MPAPSVPVNFVAHTKIKAAEVDANFAALVALLDQSLDGLNLATGTPGQLWIADAGGVYQKQAVSGDVALDSGGVSKVSLGVAQTTAGPTTLTGSYVDKADLGAAVVGEAYLLFGYVFWQAFNSGTVNSINVSINYDSAEHEIGASPADIRTDFASFVPLSGIIIPTTNAHIKIRVKQLAGSGVINSIVFGRLRVAH